MSEIEYVMPERASERDKLNNCLYFSNCNNPVYVERSVPGTYEYDSASDQESTSETLDDDTRELNENYISKRRKILLLGGIVLVIILCSVSLGIKHALTNNSANTNTSSIPDITNNSLGKIQ